MDHDDTGHQTKPLRQEVHLLEMAEGIGSGYPETEVKNDVRSYLVLRREGTGFDAHSKGGIVNLFEIEDT